MALQYDSDSALALAVRKAGSQLAFGRAIGRRQSVVHDWLREGRPLPAELVLRVEFLFGISRHALRPDIYPIDDSSSAVGGPSTPAAETPAANASAAAGVPSLSPDQATGSSAARADDTAAGCPPSPCPAAVVPLVAANGARA